MSPRHNATTASIQHLERRMLFALSLDSGFGQGGKIDKVLDPDPDSFGVDISLIHLLTDGKIIVGGTTFPGGEPILRVARYTAGGLLDPTFNGDGLSPLVGPGLQTGSPAGGGAVRGDGKIVLAAGDADELAAVRFNADGSPDSGFGGGDGIARTGAFGGGVDSGVIPTSLAFAADGDIVVAGYAGIGSALAVARFNADGAADTSYSADGKDLIIFSDIVPGTDGGLRTAGVAALAGGKILLLVNLDSDDAQPQPALIRLNADGSFDTSFGGGDGVLSFKFGDAPSGNRPNAMIVQSDGKIVVAGLDGDGDDANFDNRPAVARFNADGSLDTSFGTNGIGSAGTTDGDAPWVLTVDSAGKFVAITSTTALRWTADGDADATFGPNGQQDLPTLSGPKSALAVDSQDRILYPTGNSLVRLVDVPRPEFELGENGAIIITGDEGTADNTVTIAQAGSNIAVTRNGSTQNFPAADVKSLDILMFDGDDTIASSIDVPALVILGNGNNTLTNGDADANITAGDGADDITVGDGDHTIQTAAGNDTIATGDGQKTLDSGDGNDSITTGSGDDSVNAGAGNDTISAGGGNDSAVGGFGSDSLVGGAGDDLLVGGFDLTGSDNGDNVLHGNDGDDLLVGGELRDSLYGGANKDIMIGRAGSDLLSGGGGKDRIAGNGGNDRIYGGAGDDQLDGGVHNDRVFGGAGNDRIFGGRGIDQLHGDAGDDRFFAKDKEADAIDGGAGTNTAVLFDDVDELLNITAQP